MAIDLASLPAPDAVEALSYEAILAERKAFFASLWEAVRQAAPDLPAYDVAMLETDPAMIVLQESAYRETLLRARVNDSVRASLLAMATGADLDHVAAFWGLQRLSGESDSRLRFRTQLSIFGRSPAGTPERYRAVAMAADVRIADVVAYTAPALPVVRLAVLNSLAGGAPFPEMLAAVEAAVTADGVRVTSDRIVVESAVRRIVNVSADVWLLPSAPQAVFNGLAEALRAAWAAEGGLGRDLSLAWITARLMRPGVARVAVTAPAQDFVAGFHEAIALDAVTLTDRGRDF